MEREDREKVTLEQLQRVYREGQLEDIDGSPAIWTGRVMAEVRALAGSRDSHVGLGALLWQMAPVSLGLLVLCAVFLLRAAPLDQLAMVPYFLDVPDFADLVGPFPL